MPRFHSVRPFDMGCRLGPSTDPSPDVPLRNCDEDWDINDRPRRLHVSQVAVPVVEQGKNGYTLFMICT